MYAAIVTKTHPEFVDWSCICANVVAVWAELVAGSASVSLAKGDIVLQNDP
jgi:hypothetical protein